MELSEPQSRLLEPFVDATVNCLETMAGLTAVAGAGSQADLNSFSAGDYLFVIETQGDVSGRMIMQYHMDTTLGIGNKIRAGLLGEECEDADSINDDVIDALAEFTNVIVGRAIRSFEDDDKVISHTPPRYISDPEKARALKSGVKQVLTVPMDVEDIGKFHVHYMIQSKVEG